MKILHALRKMKVAKGSKTSYKQASELGERAFLVLFSQVSINTCIKLFNYLLPCSSFSFFSFQERLQKALCGGNPRRLGQKQTASVSHLSVLTFYFSIPSLLFLSYSFYFSLESFLCPHSLS